MVPPGLLYNHAPRLLADRSGGMSVILNAPAVFRALVAGTIVRHRVTKLSPSPASEVDLKAMFLDSMTLW